MNCYDNGALEKSPSALLGATVTILDFASNRADLICVVPGQLLARSDARYSEERHVREPQVLAVHKHVLHEHIWLTRVLPS